MTIKVWKLIAAVIIAGLIGFAVGHYGFDSPPPPPVDTTQTGP